MIPGGHEGAGQCLLPVANTSSPVDVDLLQRHHPPARAPAPDDHHQRTRRRSRGARQGSQRGHPPRQPGAAELDKVLAILAAPEQAARQPGRRIRPRPGAVRQGARTASRTSSSEPTPSPGPRPTSAARSRRTSPTSRRSCASSGRRWNGSGASPNRPRRRSPISKPRRRGSTRRSCRSPPFSSSSTAFFTGSRQERARSRDRRSCRCSRCSLA